MNDPTKYIEYRRHCDCEFTNAYWHSGDPAPKCVSCGKLYHAYERSVITDYIIPTRSAIHTNVFVGGIMDGCTADACRDFGCFMLEGDTYDLTTLSFADDVITFWKHRKLTPVGALTILLKAYGDDQCDDLKKG